MQARRQFIVCGTPTAGKSTFSSKLVQRWYVQHIQIDPIIEAFETVFPELGITHDALTQEAHARVCLAFKPFLFRMIDGLITDNFAIEGFRMPLEDLFGRYGQSHRIVVFGYPEATPAERLRKCRMHDVDNWTNVESDAKLLDVFEFLIGESRRQREICKKLSIPFFDTGQNYAERIEQAVMMADTDDFTLPPPRA